jgi:hypothetical protein
MFFKFIAKVQKLLFFLIFYFFTIACGSSKKDQQEFAQNNAIVTPQFTIPDTLNAGILYQKVSINSDELNTFALYLPKLYHKNALWPVVFFFDPNGKGDLPVKQYQALADSLGYIFIGSNVSKNGLDQQEILSMWNALKKSCLKKLSIDSERIILAGFSGGARVCCAIASKEQQIAGIIANSAAAPQLDQILNQNTVFFGLAGNGDMNRAEMLGIENYLNSTSLNHYYIEFNGIHEWAPNAVMQKALMILCIDAYLKNPTLLNSSLTDRFIANQKVEIEKLKSQDKWLEAYQELALLTNGAKGLVTLTTENLDSLKNNPNYIAQKNELMQLITKETELQQELYRMMVENPNQAKWQIKITQIKKNANFKNKLGQMNQRLLGYASLVCYSLTNRSLSAKNYSLSEIMVNCYEIADPKNPEVYFFKAILNGAKSDSLNTINNLSKAVKFGFNDKKRLNTQLEFYFLKDNVQFNQILN